MQSCDVAIVGLGVMGSSALYNLSLRGADALGFDPLALGEQRGSSHGSCRVYRRNNFENPAYGPLSIRAYDAWSRLEHRFGEKVLMPSRIVEAGVPGSALVRDSRVAAGSHVSGPVKGGEINAMFAAFRLPEDWDVVVHDDAGILRADVAMRLFRDGAAGKIIPQAVRIKKTPREITLTTADNTVYVAQKLIISAGPWLTDFVPELKDYITVTRQAVGWFGPSIPDRVKYGSFPIFILDAPEGIVYGFPDFENQGVKAAAHDHGRELGHADDSVQDASDKDLTAASVTLTKYIPAASGALRRKEICLYTNTKAGDAIVSKENEFILDRLPQDPRVIIASPCSGHGFKFASAIGEILADMATGEGDSGYPEFTLRRFAPFR